MHVRGTISSVGFRSGDRFVVGCWPHSPVGPLADVMWVSVDGCRRLMTDTDEGAAFITSIYEFDEVEVAPLTVVAQRAATLVSTERIRLALRGGWLRPVPFRRPRAFTRVIEAPIARRLMGVECYGTSPRGAHEWYQTTGWRWVLDATGELDGHDLGPPTTLRPALGVGFSDPPARPSIVRVRVAIEHPGAASGARARAAARLR